MQGLLLIGHYLVSLYCSVVLLRFLAQWLGADFRNPISQAIVQVTNPPLIPLRRFIPGWKGKDMASLVLLMTIIAIEAGLLALLLGVNDSSLVIGTILYRPIAVVLNTYFFILILTAIASWINQDPYNPLQLFFGAITAPLLRPLRKHIKPLAGMIDLTPMILLIVIYFLQYQSKIWFVEIFQQLSNPLLLNSGSNAFLGLMLN